LGLREGIVRLIEEQTENPGTPARDTANAWEPKPDGSFARLHPRGDEEPLDSQALLLEEGF
jgi:hypothetical protein